MTGRDLILYILENHLEDKPVLENGKLLGFVSVQEIAIKYNVGVATVLTWLNQMSVEALIIRDRIYIPADFKSPTERDVCTV